MAKAPTAITSPKIKKLAAKAAQSPSMLSTAETRELGASILAFLSPPKDDAPVAANKAAGKKSPAKKTVVKKTQAKRA